MKRFAILVLCFLPLVSQGADGTRELLSQVSPERAQALSDYNAVFLQEHLYFSKRHRIVEVDTDLLLEADAFTITPFDDVTPLEIVAERLSTHEDLISVKAHIVDSISPESELLSSSEIDRSAVVTMHAWDLYASNEAVLSMQNSMAFRLATQRIENDAPDGSGPVPSINLDFAEDGEPPSTPEETEQFEQNNSLQKRQFYSVNTLIIAPDGARYLVTPLRFTPRYSVIQEIDPSKLLSTRIDGPPEGSDSPSQEEKYKTQNYIEFKNSLPDESDKIILGDLL